MRSIIHWLGSGVRPALLCVGIATIAAGCGEKSAANEGMARGRPGGPGGARVAPVEIALVEVGTIARHVLVSGVVEPIRSVGINSQLSGAIMAVDVQEGDVVRTGTVLARLDDRELRAQVASAEAAYEVAAATFQRSEQLRARQVITAAEYDRDRAALAAAEAQLAQLRTRLDYTTVRAPINGIITEKRVEAGDIVGAQTRLFTIAVTDTMVVRVQVSELDVVELRPGATVSVVLDAYPDRRIDGRIRRIFPSADPATRLVPVEVALQGEAASIARAGFLARVDLTLGARSNVLLVPAAAIVGDADAPAVFVHEDGIARRRSVRTGATSEGRVEILSGLAAGEAVITLGNNTLRDGMQVRVVERPGPDPAERMAPAARNQTGGDR